MTVMPGAAYALEGLSLNSLDEAALLEKYPAATIIHVSTEEYPALEKKLRQQGYRKSRAVPLQLAEYYEEADDRKEHEQRAYKSPHDECAGSGLESAGDASFRVMVDFTEDVMKSGNSSSGDEAAVLFIVVGTVVLVVWALYVFKYVYDVSTGFRPCGRWKELAVVTSTTSTGDHQHARFDGVRLSAGFRDGMTDVGISFELGQTDILLREIGVLELQGSYWLLGPMLRWRLSDSINPAYFQMNFTAGTTEHSEIGLIARASFGLLFGIGDSMQLGLSWGAMNINLDEDQGLISDHSQYYYLYGINVGIRF